MKPGGKRSTALYEGWIVADAFGKMIRVLLTGPQGLGRTVTFPVDEAPALIEQMVRETIEE